MHDKAVIAKSKIWVVKIGSALLTHPESGLNNEVITHLVDQIAALRDKGISVVLVSSGSIAEGLRRLSIKSRPKEIHMLQAAAATGQMGLVHSYELAFQRHNVICAQILLTHADLANRLRYLNARRTLQTLLEMDAMPIVNENDTVVTDELRGDNDTLGALVANLMEADALVILTDQDGLYKTDPRLDTNAEKVHLGDAGDPALTEMAGGSGELGTGGMLTKLHAAQKAARSGTITVILNGRNNNTLERVLKAEDVGTWLFPSKQKMAARKQWIAGHAKPHCRLLIDQGAVNVLLNDGRSLLPIGVKRIEGTFARGDVIVVADEQGNEIASGLVNYSSTETVKIIGKPSTSIEQALGYVDDAELIHRDNLVINR